MFFVIDGHGLLYPPPPPRNVGGGLGILESGCASVLFNVDHIFQLSLFSLKVLPLLGLLLSTTVLAEDGTRIY